MIGAIMFVLLIGLMFIGIPIAFSMGLSAVLMLLINATATPVATPVVEEQVSTPVVTEPVVETKPVEEDDDFTALINMLNRGKK